MKTFNVFIIATLEFSANVWKVSSRTQITRSELNFLFAAKGLKQGELYRILYADAGKWQPISESQVLSVSTGETFSQVQYAIVTSLQDGKWHKVNSSGFVDDAGDVHIKSLVFDNITIIFKDIVARPQYCTANNWPSSVTTHWQINASENSDPATIQIWGWNVTLMKN